MNSSLIPTIAVAASVVLVAYLYLRLTASQAHFDDLAGDWREIDPRRYAPLARLLAPDDFAYLRTLPGYDFRLEKELRIRRLNAFQAFLADLVRDFNTLQRVGQLLVVTGQASPLLREQLLLARVAFTRALWQIRLEMVLFRIGGRPVVADRLLSAMRDACGALQLDPQLSRGAA